MGEEDNVSKLLGAIFGLSLSTANVDNFLHAPLVKKLTHWSSTRINPTGREMVPNNVILSSLFFYLFIWGGTKKRVGRLKSSIMTYIALWQDSVVLGAG